MKKNKRGITLIALVVTIVIMVILAAVTITMAIENNGVIDKAEEALKETQKEEGREELLFSIIQMNIDELGELSLEKIKNGIQTYKPEIQTVEETNENTLDIFYKGYIYTLDNNLQIIKIEPIGKLRVILQKEITYDRYAEIATLQIEANLLGDNPESITVQGIQMEGKEEISGSKASFEITKNGKYKFFIKLSNGERIEKYLTVNEIIKIQVISIEEIEENTKNKITLSVDFGGEDGTVFYQLGKHLEDFLQSNIEVVEKNGDTYNIIIPSTEKEITICAKQKVGPTQIAYFDLRKEVNVFTDITESGKTLKEYGFTASWTNNCERKSFGIGNIGAGKWSGSGSFSGTFNIDWKNFRDLNINKIYIGFMLQADGPSSITGAITVYYKDGTSEKKQTATKNGGNVGQYILYPAEIDLQAKTIQNIQLTIWRI